MLCILRGNTVDPQTQVIPILTKKQKTNDEPKKWFEPWPLFPSPLGNQAGPFFSENLCLFYVRHINFKRLPLLRCKFSHHFHFSEFCWESNFSFIQSSHFHFHFSLSKTQILAKNYHLLRNSLPWFFLLSGQFLFLFSDFVCLAFDQFEEHRMIALEWK